MNTKILVCAHKLSLVANDSTYMPIHVGKSLSNKEIGYIGDDEGDNISEKNGSYCELTAMYWAWKNLPADVEYVGLNHYRRYFYFDPSCCFIQPVKQITESEFKSYISRTPVDMKKYMGKHDIILARPLTHAMQVSTMYCNNAITEDFVILQKVILKLYPEYESTMQKCWQCSNKNSYFNMFITSRKIFENYSSWLFSILFETEKYVKLSPYVNQQRVFGFMGELLLPLYCIHNKLNIKYCPIFIVGENGQQSSNMKYLVNKLRADFSFLIGHKPLKKLDTPIKNTLKNR